MRITIAHHTQSSLRMLPRQHPTIGELQRLQGEATAANVAEVRLTEDLLAEADPILEPHG